MAVEFPLLTRLTAKDSASTVLSNFAAKANRLGKKMRRMGRQWSVAVTAPIGALGFAIGRTAVEFESQMNRVAALTGATGDTFDQLNATARELGAATAFSASEAAAGMGFLAQAGFDTEQIVKAIPSALSLASAGMLDLAEAADIGSNVMTGFGLKVDDFTRIADVLAFTAQNSNTNVRQLGDAFKFAGPVAVSAGLKLEQVAGIVGALSDAGIQGEMAGTALRGAIGKLVAPSGEAVKILKRLGFAQRDIVGDDGKLRDLVGILGQLSDAGATTGDVLSIFGQRAGTGIAALLTQVRTSGLSSLTDRISSIQAGAAGSAQAQAERQLRGLPGALKTLRSAFEELSLAINASGFGKFLEDAANRARDFARWAGKLPGPVLAGTTAIAGLAAAVGPLLFGLGAAAKVGSIMATGFGLLKTAFVATRVVLLGQMIPAVWAFTTALLANPVGLVIAGIAALIVAGVALYKNWDKVAGFFAGIWDRIKSSFGDGVAWVTGKLDGLVGKLGGVGRFFGFGDDDAPSATPPRLPGSPAAASAFPSGQGQDGRARVEIDVRSDGPGVRARMVEARDVELSLEQGVALGVS